MVSANRDMLIAIAGVFFLLPELIGAVALPVLQLHNDMSQQQMADAVLRFYSVAGPPLIALSLPLLLGYLTMLTILVDRDRPTVAAAIGISLRLLPGYVVAQVIIALVLSLVWATVLAALSLMMPQAVAALLSVVIMIYPLTRVILVGPEMVARRLRNPVRAITGALLRTRGRFAGLVLFFGPALTLFVVVYVVVSIVIAVALPRAIPIEVQRLIGEAIGAGLLAAGHTYFAAMVASTYQQLGPINGEGATASPSHPG